MRMLTVSLVQVGLLAYCYSDPASRLLPSVIYLPLLVLNSGSLLVLAHQGFQRQRLAAAVAAALLAFPGLFLSIAALVLLIKRH